jgi:hypothetical protein
VSFPGPARSVYCRIILSKVSYLPLDQIIIYCKRRLARVSPFQIFDFQFAKNAGQWPSRAPVGHFFCQPGLIVPSASCQDGRLPQSSYHHSGILCVYLPVWFSLILPVCLRLPNSVACEALACPEWCIYVSHPALPCFP